MFIRFFRSSFPIQYLVIGLIGLVLWGKSFITPPPLPDPEGPVPVYDLLHSMLNAFPHLAVIAGFILVLLETWWINALFRNNELVMKNSSLASLIFIILMSSSPAYLTIQPLNICILLTLVILNNLMISYSRAEDLDLVYGSGFFTALGSLIYFPYLLMLIIIPVSFILFRSNKWREWAAALIGFLTPFIFLAAYYFLTDQLIKQIMVYKQMISSFLFYPLILHIDDWVIIIFTLVLALWGLYYMVSGSKEKTVEVRAKTYLIVWLIVIVLLSAAYSTTLVVYHLVMLFPTLTLLLTSAFLGIKKVRWAEIIFLLYFLLILVNSYFYNPQ